MRQVTLQVCSKLHNLERHNTMIISTLTITITILKETNINRIELLNDIRLKRIHIKGTIFKLNIPIPEIHF